MSTNENEGEEKVEGEEVEETKAKAENSEAEPGTKSEEDKQEKSSESPEDRASRLLRQTNQARKKLGLPALEETKPESKSTKKSDDLDDGKKALLVAYGFKGAKEFEFVKGEMKASGENIDSLMENDYFKAKLEKFRALDKTSKATPTGKRSSGIATESVEYWATKPFEEVPKDLRQKVVNYKLDKEKNKGQFYNS